VIGRNARLQAQLIEDILDVSRIIAGKLDIERLPVAVAPLLDTAVAGIAPLAEAKHITLAQHVAPDLPAIEADPKRLYQVLNNVLSNAIKFTPEGGSVTLTCEVDGNELHIRVRDSGIGIDQEFMPSVFERFRQADSRSTRNHGGLGLGLAIARHLVEQHGGQIQAFSEGRDKGTTVSIRVPSTTKPSAAASGDAVTSVRSATSLHGIDVVGSVPA
jgi:signal transduction histidine kinase